MEIQGISLINGIDTKDIKINKVNENEEINFSKVLEKALDTVNQKQIDSETMTQKAILGEVDNVHDVLLAAEEAKLSLELTVQIRNKIVEAYQEINRMQI